MAYVPAALIHRLLGTAAVAVAVGLIGCSQNSSNSSESGTTGDSENPLNVVATSSVLCDLTEQIAADTIDLTCLMAPSQDPHTYQLKPSDRQRLDQADLVFYGGYNAEPGIYRSLEASSADGPKVAVYEAAVPEPLMVEAHSHAHGEEDHNHAHTEEDHDHGEPDAESASDGSTESSPVPDPHIWHRAEHNAEMVKVIALNLQQMNPAEADRYRARADRLSAEFRALHDWIRTQVETVPSANRELITPHAAFNYYAEAYGLRVRGALSGLSTAEKPSAAQLTALVEQVKAAAVPAIFAETTTAPDLIQTLAKEAGVTVAAQPLYVEGPAEDAQAPTLQAMLVTNTCTIVNALGGSCQAETAPGGG
ncbi:metal ABC transporter substrate-binding protein [filamentous cyanobacterium CCP5]|nr:metal ABC transporter substrate-binding protein [filamentous cyanobacterium CCP5]